MGKVATMTRIGAKLTNDCWGWDGVREDGSIVFKRCGSLNASSRCMKGKLSASMGWRSLSSGLMRQGNQI